MGIVAIAADVIMVSYMVSVAVEGRRTSIIQDIIHIMTYITEVKLCAA